MFTDPVGLCDLVSVRSDARFGMTAFAARSINRGEVVLCEAPMLVMQSTPIDDDKMDPTAMMRRSVLRAFITVAASVNVPAKFFEAVWSMVLSPDVDAAKVLAIEASLYSPPCATQSKVEQQAVTALLQSTADIFDTCFPPTECKNYHYWKQCRNFGDKGIARVLKLIHACRVNIHEACGSGYVFHKASKLAHSCNANTFWMMDTTDVAAPRVVHIALRPIAQDEVLSFSYIGSGLNLLLPMLHRREMLSDLSFRCVCARCVAAEEIDSSRLLRCPQCATAERHVFTLGLNVKQGQWVCSQCDVVCSKEEAMSRIFFDERALGTAVMHFFFGHVARDADGHKSWQSLEHSSVSKAITAAENPLVQRWVVCTCVVDILGRGHYLFACAYSGLMLALARCLGDEEKTTTDFVALLRYVRRGDSKTTWTAQWIQLYRWALAWFATHVPESAQEAKTLLLFGECLDGFVASDLLTKEEKEDMRAFRAILCDRREHPVQRFQALIIYRDFKPLLQSTTDTIKDMA
jgi:hypothetical protein